MLPRPYRVTARRVETRDSVTLHLEPLAGPVPPVRPGQFTMLCRPGVGEIAVSVSGDPADTGALVQTVRDVGAVSGALARSVDGDVLGVRGPFGTGWDLDSVVGRDLVLVAGGVGLAPLRPALLAAVADRGRYGRIVLIAGARGPAEFLFGDQLAGWAASAGLEVELTVDQPAEGWTGPVGFVTEPVARLRLEPRRCTAFLCGPEPMLRFTAATLLRKGLAAADIRLSVERDMKCGVALCGHCQLGPLLVCRDGPVLDWARARPLLAVRQL
jgi:NAD(P)H-flavin reductase